MKANLSLYNNFVISNEHKQNKLVNNFSNINLFNNTQQFEFFRSYFL